MSDQTNDILRELVKNTKSMKRYVAVFTFLVLLVTIMPIFNGAITPRQDEQEAVNELNLPLGDDDPDPFVLEEEWILG